MKGIRAFLIYDPSMAPWHVGRGHTIPTWRRDLDPQETALKLEPHAC